MAGGARKNADSVLVAALASGVRNDQAATQAGVSEATVYRRLADADFRQQITVARSEMVDQTTGRLAVLSAAAAATLGKLLTANSETVRLGAARAILELGGKWRESEEIEARLTALEEQLAVQQPTGSRWAA